MCQYAICVAKLAIWNRQYCCIELFFGGHPSYWWFHSGKFFYFYYRDWWKFLCHLLWWHRHFQVWIFDTFRQSFVLTKTIDFITWSITILNNFLKGSCHHSSAAFIPVSGSPPLFSEYLWMRTNWDCQHFLWWPPPP